MKDNEIEFRKAEADRWWELRQKTFEYSRDYGASTVRSLILINGGAVVALIAAISNIASKSEKIAMRLATALTPSLACFLVGLVLAIATGVFAYFNFYNARESMPRPNELTHYIATGNKSGWKSRSQINSVTMYLAVASAITSILGFIGGSYFAIAALRQTFENP